MTIETIDIDLFLEIAKLHPNVIAQIFDYLPKCLLPHLLYFPPIREIAASVILSDVEITEDVERHMWFDGFRLCQCLRFNIKLDNLKQGIAQWNIYPHTFHMEHVEQFERVLDTFPKLITAALSINGTFYGKEGLDSKAMLNFFLDSNIMFDSIELLKFEDTLTLPSIARNVALHRTALDSYTIYGMKKLDIKIIPDDDDDEGTQIFTFPASLEDLQIKTRLLTGVILPPTLRRLCLVTHLKQIEISSEGMPILEYLLLELPCIDVLNNNQIIAPNLKTLHLKKCLSMRGYNGLKKFQHLKHLKIKRCAFPIGLFEEFQFPELEIFTYNGHDRVYLKDAYNPRLPFPRNLKCLSIKSYDLDSIHPYNLELPAGLERLELMYLTFSDGYFHFSDNLRYIRIYTPTLTFHKDFRLPQSAQEFILNADCLTFDRLYFLHKLPENLLRLHLIANKLCVMRPITKKIQWPSMLSSLYLKGFAINSGILKLLNLRQTCLEEITICGGYVPILSEEMFPVSVKELTLQRMGIRSLSSSFKSLKNLQRLSLIRNNLKDISSVRLPLATLKSLDLSYSHVPLLTPFLIAFLSEKYKNAELEVDARGNQEIDINDVLMAMQEYRRLSVCLSMINGTRTQLPMDPTRLEFVYESFDSYHERYENSDNDPDDMDSDGEDDDVERRRMGLH